MNKLIIYQIFTRLFCNSQNNPVPHGPIDKNGCGKLNNFTDSVLETIREMGTTHIWFTGIIAHASCTDYSRYGIPSVNKNTVKGIAGSPYAITDYYDIDPDLAVNVRQRMKEFTNLIDRVHSHDMKMIIDFVPNHVARQYKSLKHPTKVTDLGDNDDISKSFDPQNNYYYIPEKKLAGQINWNDYIEYPAKVTGNDRFDASPSLFDWYDTVKLNYGVNYEGGRSTHFSPIPDTWHKMLDILLFWAKKGIDGFRCDMAEMVPVEFWHWSIDKVKKRYPKIIFIAEIYNPGSYSNYLNHGYFDYIYDKLGLYDTLRAVTLGHESATSITRCWQNYATNGEHMLHFMENHDEQRIASDFFAGSGEKGKAAMIVSATMDTCPIMIYAGQEFGERGMDIEGYSGLDGRTTIFDYWAVNTLSRWYTDGKLQDIKLTNSEKKLKDFYYLLLHICKHESAISQGKFFDLMYVNPSSPVFSAHKQYAYLRKSEDSLLLIVANFDDKTQQSTIFIPNHAFEYMQITPCERIEALDLLSGKIQTIDLYPNCNIRVTVPANSGIILKFLT